MSSHPKDQSNGSAGMPRPAIQAAGHAPAMGGHEEMMAANKRQMLWTYFANIILGGWLLLSPASFGYDSSGLTISDISAGTAVIVLGTIALFPAGDFWGRWGICLAGIWLLFAPLLFNAPEAASYLNGTLVGSLLIAFSVLVPMMPGKAHHMAMMAPGPDIPPGWTYNPSTFLQRGPIIALALVSFLLARYMAAFQLGHVDEAWDPIFGRGTELILTSDVSQWWPIPDAGLGAFSYLLEALSGFMGGRRRWRTMPWMVLMFGVLVVPLGVTSITLVILQPVMVGQWCSICLLTALLMLVMIPIAVDEVAAMIGFMVAARREGQPLLRTFFVGGTLNMAAEADGGDDAEFSCPMHPEVRSREPGRCPRCGMALVRQPEGSAQEGTEESRPLDSDDRPSLKSVPAMLWGVTLPSNLLVVALLGMWLLAAPEALGVDRQAASADSNHLAGALVATIAVVSWAEVVRSARFLNVAVGVWVLIAAWFLPGADTSVAIHDTLVGVAIVVLSLPKGGIRQSYGGWTRRIA